MALTIARQLPADSVTPSFPAESEALCAIAGMQSNPGPQTKQSAT